MEELLAIALVGTAKKRPATTKQSSTAAELVEQLSDLSPERQLLLEAGASSVFEFAGASSSLGKRCKAPAPTEERQIVSPRAAPILAELLQQQGGDHDLLIEACNLLREHQQILAPELLPEALSATNGALQTALQPVLGQRGRWLSQFDNSWKWATAALTGEGAISEQELESQWNEGSPVARQAALDRVRRTNSERARQWLGEAWPREKAEMRLQLLTTIGTSLGNDDVLFLESLADDRSLPVRALASELLCKLEAPALAAKMRGWCDSLLSRAEPKKSLTSKLRKLAGVGAGLCVSITPPVEFDPAWRELGINEKPPANIGQRAYWLIELVRRVPPKHWQQKFEAAPRDLIAAVVPDDFGHDLIHAWSEATALFAANEWANALWEYWLEFGPPKNDPNKFLAPGQLLKLLRNMSADRAAQAMIECMSQQQIRNIPLRELIDTLPKPWNAQFGAAYLKRRGALLAGAADNSDRVAWAETLPIAAVALPTDCFTEALRSWTLPDTDDYYSRHLNTQIAKFQEIVQRRARLRELITTH